MNGMPHLTMFPPRWVAGFCFSGGLVSGLAEEGDHDALDDEFVGGDEVGVGGVFGAEVGAAASEEVGFEGAVAVDEGCDDAAVGGGLEFEDDDVAVEDVGAGHRVAADAEGEGAGVSRDAEGVDVHVDAAVAVFGLEERVAGGDGAEEGDGGEAGFRWLARGEGAGEALGGCEGSLAAEGGDVLGGGVGAGVAEVVLDVAEGGADAVAAAVGGDEVQGGLLAGREIHGGLMITFFAWWGKGRLDFSRDGDHLITHDPALGRGCFFCLCRAGGGCAIAREAGGCGRRRARGGGIGVV